MLYTKQIMVCLTMHRVRIYPRNTPMNHRKTNRKLALGLQILLAAAWIFNSCASIRPQFETSNTAAQEKTIHTTEKIANRKNTRAADVYFLEGTLNEAHDEHSMEQLSGNLALRIQQRFFEVPLEINWTKTRVFTPHFIFEALMPDTNRRQSRVTIFNASQLFQPVNNAIPITNKYTVTATPQLITNVVINGNNDTLFLNPEDIQSKYAQIKDRIVNGLYDPSSFFAFEMDELLDFIVQAVNISIRIKWAGISKGMIEIQWNSRPFYSRPIGTAGQ